MYIAFDIEEPNPMSIPSPFLQKNNSSDENILNSKIDKVKVILSKMNLNYELKMCSELTLLSNNPNIPMEEFIELYS